jgi:hypothetical protein
VPHHRQGIAGHIAVMVRLLAPTAVGACSSISGGRITIAREGTSSGVVMQLKGGMCSHRKRIEAQAWGRPCQRDEMQTEQKSRLCIYV